MDYSEILKTAQETLKSAGINEAENDARLLLMHVTGKDRSFILAHGGEKVGFAEERQYLSMIEKRAGHIPLQLITGKTDFMGLEFLVSPKVLIPRIDTEFLAEEALRWVYDGARVLDMCTGSGCILLSLMRYKNDIEGVGADISPDAIALARANAERLQVKNVQFVLSDLFNGVSGCFDFILCNPPYIKSGDIDGLMEEVRLHEPHNALDGGEDGLSFYRRIAAEAGDFLNGGGRILFETGFDEGEPVSEIMREAGYVNIEVFKDYSGNERVVSCLKS